MALPARRWEPPLRPAQKAAGRPSCMQLYAASPSAHISGSRPCLIASGLFIRLRPLSLMTRSSCHCRDRDGRSLGMRHSAVWLSLRCVAVQDARTP